MALKTYNTVYLPTDKWESLCLEYKRHLRENYKKLRILTDVTWSNDRGQRVFLYRDTMYVENKRG
jgi:hypothetical protein